MLTTGTSQRATSVSRDDELEELLRRATASSRASTKRLRQLARMISQVATSLRRKARA
jgi:hypothetical protein